MTWHQAQPASLDRRMQGAAQLWVAEWILECLHFRWWSGAFPLTDMWSMMGTFTLIGSDLAPCIAFSSQPASVHTVSAQNLLGKATRTTYSLLQSLSSVPVTAAPSLQRLVCCTDPDNSAAAIAGVLDRSQMLLCP